MSTKTTFKRIALVAVAALGLGVLSVAPSQATISGLAISGVTAGSAGNTSETASRVYTDSTTAAKFTLSGYLDQYDSITISITPKSVPTGGTTDARFLNFDSSTPTTASGTYLVYTTGTTTAVPVQSGTSTPQGVSDTATAISIRSTSSSTMYLNHTFGVQLESTTGSRVAGTYTFSVIIKAKDTLGGGALQTLTQDVSIVVAATAAVTSAANTTVASASSTAWLNAGTATSATADTVVTAVATADNSTVGTVYIRTLNSSGLDAAESITAVVTGPGLICLSSTCGKSLTVAGSGTTSLLVRADGNAGVATIAVSTPTVTFAAKTVTFYAKAAKTITAAVYNPVLKVGANASAIAVTAVDANGTNWSGQAYIVASAAADALVGGSATTPVACAYSSADKTHFCPVTTIATGTAKFKVIDASTVALATATSNEVTVTVSNAAPTSVKLAFDKATYAPFEKAMITVTVLDKDGKTLQGQAYTNLLAAGGITSTYAFGSSSDTTTAISFSTDAATSAGSTTAGAKTYVVYMPASGDVVITATGGTALAAAGQVAVKASASVVNSSVDAATDAANEATDAANAATDAALAAADAADAATAAAQDASDAVAALSATVAKLVASLKAQITSLTNLVIKIQKKVKA